MLLCHPAQGVCRRVASLTPMALPGGEAAIRQPWRIAHGLLLELGCLASPEATHTTGGYPLPWCLPVVKGPVDALAPAAEAQTCAESTLNIGPAACPVNFPAACPVDSPAASPAALRLLGAMLAKNIQCPTSSSLGRLFDAVAALLGLCLHVTYEGQAAIRLEEAQLPEDDAPHKAFPTGASPLLLPPATPHAVPLFNAHALFRTCVQALEQGSTPAQVATLFHTQLGHGLASVAGSLARQHGVQHVGLAGGCLQNATLLRLLCCHLRSQGLTPLYHTQLPPNDGSVALGQAFFSICMRNNCPS